jgi:DNA-binding MltR family transcriptional regulator
MTKKLIKKRIVDRLTGKLIHSWHKQTRNSSKIETAILSTSYLSEFLARLISKLLVKDDNEIDEFLGIPDGFNSPLSSFSARIKASYCLGLITKEEKESLEIIRKIRNMIAHDLTNSDFNSFGVISLCILLKPYSIIDLFTGKEESNPYNLFINAISFFLMSFQRRTLRRLNKRRLRTPGKYYI